MKKAWWTTRRQAEMIAGILLFGLVLLSLQDSSFLIGIALIGAGQIRTSLTGKCFIQEFLGRLGRRSPVELAESPTDEGLLEAKPPHL